MVYFFFAVRSTHIVPGNFQGFPRASLPMATTLNNMLNGTQEDKLYNVLEDYIRGCLTRKLHLFKEITDYAS